MSPKWHTHSQPHLQLLIPPPSGNSVPRAPLGAHQSPFLAVPVLALPPHLTGQATLTARPGFMLSGQTH